MRSPHSGRSDLLAASDYERMLWVLEACAGAGSLNTLRESLLDALATKFGYRHLTMLIGPTRGRTLQDAGALSLGRPERMVPEYVEHYHKWDPLQQLVARHGVTVTGRVLMLNQTRGHLTDENRRFLTEHLYKGGMHAVLCMEGAGQAVHLGLALFDEYEGAFTARDVAIIQHLGRLLTRQAELITRLPPTSTWTTQLTRREAEVAHLVVRGCTNQEIAAALCITVDTAKKHVKAACLKAGAANRARLAAQMAGTGTSSLPSTA